MGNPEKLHPEQPEEIRSNEKLSEKPTPEKTEKKPSDALLAFKNGLSVFQERHPDERYFGLLKKDGSFTDRGKEFTRMMFGYWMSKSGSYDEFQETLFEVGETGKAFLSKDRKERAVLRAVLNSAESRLQDVDRKLAEYRLEARFPGIEAQILPWELAHMRREGRLLLLSGNPEVAEAITGAFAAEELAGPVAERERSLLAELRAKLGDRFNLGEIRTALNIALAGILPGREITQVETAEEAMSELCGAPGSRESEKIIREAEIAAEDLATLVKNSDKISANTVEEVLGAVQPEESLGSKIFNTISYYLPISPRVKAEIAAGILMAGFLLTLARPPPRAEAAEPPYKETAVVVEIEPTSMPDPRIEFAKPEGLTPQYWERFPVGLLTEVPVSLNPSYGFTREQLENLPGITQAGFNCKVTTLAWGIDLLSPEKDIHPVELSNRMREEGLGEIETLDDLNRFVFKPDRLEPYGVTEEMVSLRKVMQESSLAPWEALADRFKNELRQGNIPVIFHRAYFDKKRGEIQMHTMLVLGIGFEEDGTPYAILGETHRGDYIPRWPYFQESGFEKVGDYVKLRFTKENWEGGLSKHLGADAWVLSRTEEG